jgi:hypothetical protein
VGNHGELIFDKSVFDTGIAALQGASANAGTPANTLSVAAIEL